ncbi:MAG: glutathione S-transferase [Cyanobacteria bacterium J06642_2]
MLTVHHLNHSRSQRVLWMLEELGVEYDIKFYERNSDTMLAPAELRTVHPLGKSPVITDGELTLAESGAILEYLVERYGNGRFIPTPGKPERWRYTYWLHYAEGSMMPLLFLPLLFARIEQRPMPFFARPIAQKISERTQSAFIGPQIARHLDFLESELAKSLWFAGDEFTAADIQMSFPLEVAVVRAGLDDRHPNLMAFLQRIRARPAYQQAIARGGEFHILS